MKLMLICVAAFQVDTINRLGLAGWALNKNITVYFCALRRSNCAVLCNSQSCLKRTFYEF